MAAIVHLMQSGELNADWAKNAIQRCRHSMRTRPKFSYAVDIVDYWEANFPGKGDLLMDVFEPFYEWTPSLVPALPELESLVRKAMFWHGVSGVRTFTLSDITKASRNQLFRKLIECPKPEDDKRVKYMDSVWLSSWGKVYRHALGEVLEKRMQACFRPLLGGSLQGKPWCFLGSPLSNIFWQFIRGAGLLAVSEEAELAMKLRPFQELLLAGNYPLGLDPEGKINVLVSAEA